MSTATSCSVSFVFLHCAPINDSAVSINVATRVLSPQPQRSLSLSSHKTKKARKLVRPREAFDPEVPELPSLLLETRFPAAVFRNKDVLAALRPLGLRPGHAGLGGAAGGSVDDLLERGEWGSCTEIGVRLGTLSPSFRGSSNGHMRHVISYRG